MCEIMGTRKHKKADALVAEPKYEGKYVAFDPSVGKEVIASGKDPGDVIARARKRGVKVPAIVFVPKNGVTYIY